MINEVIDGRYRIMRLLGEGGMGAVYEALHLGTGRRVALKLILGEEASRNGEIVGRFMREARAAGAIDTQHIVQVLDSGIDKGRGLPFMVMEFLAGEDLEHLGARLGPLPPELVQRIAAQACIGLQKAHDAGVIHRDIKPANIYLATRDGGEVLVKLLDFGIAKIKVDQFAASEGHGLTRTGSLLGSPLYMSPEQARGLKSIDHRTDLWSLGAVLYESLTGKTPHHDVDTLGQLILAICSDAPRPVQTLAPWVPPEIAAVVERALSLDPAARFPSASAMLEEIQPLLKEGSAVRREQLVPLPEATRHTVARRSAAAVTASPLDATRSSAWIGPLRTTSGAGSVGKSGGGVARVVLAAALLAGVGFGGWSLLHERFEHKAADKPQSSSVVVVESAPAVVASVPAAPAALAPTSSVAPLRSNHVQVSPAQALVWVDGQSAAVTAGAIEIQGPLGSAHDVRVAFAGHELKAQVVLAETGAVPARLRLETGTSRLGAHASHASAEAAAPSHAASPANPKPNSGALDKSFE